MRRAALQRGGVHEQLVFIRARVQADIADREEGGLVFAVECAGALHHREVEPRFLQFGDVLYRQVGQDALVALAAQHEAVDVHRLRHAGERRAVPPVGLEVPAAAAAAALVLVEEARHFAFAHAQELDVHLGDVERDHGQAAAAARGQHAALRGEARQRRQVAGMDAAPGLAAQLRAIGSGQLRRHGHRIVAVGLGIGIAQRAVVFVQRPAALARGWSFKRHQAVEILGGHQRLRELQHQRQPVAALIGPGPGQRETLDLRALGLNRLAARRRQLPRRIAPAGGQRQGRRHGQQEGTASGKGRQRILQAPRLVHLPPSS